jgi:hypothetical protein
MPGLTNLIMDDSEVGKRKERHNTEKQEVGVRLTNTT